MTPEEVVQIQLDNYNQRNLDGYAAVFHPQITIRREQNGEPVLEGMAAMREFYANKRFNLPNLHCELKNRICIGNKVIDHELVFGVNDEPIEMVAVYTVVDNLITDLWFISP